jgi:hypothetical protein
MEDAIDTIREAFYEALIEADAKGRQVAKRDAAKKLIYAGMDCEVARMHVQRWFDAIREQQKA